MIHHTNEVLATGTHPDRVEGTTRRLEARPALRPNSLPRPRTSGEDTPPTAPTSRWSLRRLIALLGTFVLSGGLFCLHIAVYNPLSPVDEIQHIDYALHLMNGDLISSGATFTPEGQDIAACRWIDTAGPPTMPCGGPYELDLMPGGGFDTAYMHAPFYYLTPAALAVAAGTLGVDGDLVNAMRLSSVLWWFLFVPLAWRLFRELGIDRWTRAAGLVLLAASPVILQTHTIVNNDVTALPAGAAITLAALLWDRHALKLRWLVVLAAVAVALKSTNITIVIAVAGFMVLRHWQSRPVEDRWSWIPPRRTTLAVGALAAASVLVGVGWTIVQAQLQIVDPALVPQNQAFLVDHYEPVWLLKSMDAFFSPINPEFYDSAITGDAAQLIAVITDYGLIILAIFGAARAEAGSRVRALALALGAAAVLVPMLLSIVNYESMSIFVLITSRYGLTLVPAMLAIGLMSVRSAPARVALLAVAVGSTALMAVEMVS